MHSIAALAQIDSIVGDLKRNIERHTGYTKRALEGGANLVVFPELSLSGYSLKDLDWETAIRPGCDDILGDLKELSRDISIIAGGVEESGSFGLHNSVLLIENGAVSTIHRKLYPPTYGMFEELRHFSAGTTVRAADSRIGRIGALICEELWHLPLPYLLAKDGATVIIGIAASPTRITGEDAHLGIARVNSEQHRTIARLLSSYVLFCNRIGFEDGVNFWGGSEIIGPHGEPIVQARFFDEDLVFAEIDDQEIRRARRLSRHYLDDDPHLVLRELRRILRHPATSSDQDKDACRSS